MMDVAKIFQDTITHFFRPSVAVALKKVMILVEKVCDICLSTEHLIARWTLMLQQYFVDCMLFRLFT